MISRDDARRTLEFDEYYVIQPVQDWWDGEKSAILQGSKPCPEDFEYTSDNNDRWLSTEDLKQLVVQVENDS